MDLNKLKQISIKEYLDECGIVAVKEKSHYGMYLSPFRSERTPSLKVDYNKNLWIDFGAQQGGTIIDMVMQFEECTIQEAIDKLKNRIREQPIFIGKRSPYPAKESSIVISEVKTLQHPALISYINRRKIDIGIAKKYCSEVAYRIGDKHYYAVGFQNDTGGYELRNRYFKGCTSKNITTINNGSSSCLVFEGFMDYLSHLTLNKMENSTDNMVVLNSITNLNKAKPFITSHKKVYTYLDNDNAGITATNDLINVCQSLENRSITFKEFKDYNDYLMLCG